MAGRVAEIVLPTGELRDDIPVVTATPGMCLDPILPADDPREGVVSGHGNRRIETGADAAPGTCVEIDRLDLPVTLPAPASACVARRSAGRAPRVVGPVGKHCRDDPGRSGRVDPRQPYNRHEAGLDCGDQGPQFRPETGNRAIEPPRLRHRVPDASGTVAAIGIPAGHVTTAECDMTLPKGRVGPDRRFVRRRVRDAELRSFGMPAFVDRTAEIAADTGCLAGVNVARRGEEAPVWTVQDAGIRFTFGIAESLVLKGEGRSPQRPVAGDAFAIPPGMRTRYAGRSDGVARCAGRSDGVERLEASRPGAVEPAVG